MSVVIKVEHLSKSYIIRHQGQSGYVALRDVIADKVKGTLHKTKNLVTNRPVIKTAEKEEFWALNDVNFDVRQGERVGIIGRNGAGKSTLLKVLSRITEPTLGRMTIKGRIASLLEVGTGFHPELTGRENIFLNGAILGMHRAEIKSKFDEIVAFSEVEKFLDTPVKRYSSGMYVRLAFAVAAYLESEILVIDEVLAVGDAEFQKKCLGKMHDVSQYQGRTVLFVSHNITAIEQLCSGVMLIDKGKILLTGNTVEVINEYLKTNTIVSGEIIDAMKICNNQIMVESITINNLTSNMIEISPEENKLNINIRGRLAEERRMALEVRFFDQYDHLQMLYSPGHLYGQIKIFKKGNFEMNETIVLPDSLTKNEFRLTIDITQPNIEVLVSFPNSVKVNCKGIQGRTGLEFPATKSGLLMLK